MSADVETRVIGTHKLTIQGDVVYLIQLGDYSEDDAIKMNVEVERVLSTLGRVFVLVDQSKAGRTSPAARRCISEWNKKHKASGSAVFGGGITSRAAATLVIAAIRLFRPDTAPTVFTENETSARAWIAEQRTRLLGARHQ